MIEVVAFAGVCGFITRVIGKDKGGYNAELTIDSECPNWQEVKTGEIELSGTGRFP